MSFFNRPIETLGRGELRGLQERKLVSLTQKLATNRFFLDRCRAAGIDLREIETLERLRGVPFTEKSDLVEEQAVHPPFGRLPTYPLGQYRYLHQTSGTTGRPLRWLDTEDDWATWIRCWGFVYRAAGVTEQDLVYGAFSFGPYVSHWAAMAGARGIGALGLSGAGQSSEQRLRAMLDNRCTVLVCTPTYALHLAEVARQCGLDIRGSDVRITIHAGEPGASIPSVRQRVEDEWGARCFDHAGATEVGAWGFECGESPGAMHLNETEFVFEVIDPATGEPAAVGTRGELVVTPLGRAGMPVLRYRTGDLVEPTTEPCGCGRSLARIRGGVVGRVDDMLIVRGVNLYPSALDNILRGVPEVLEYEVEIRREAGLDDLLVKIETVGDRPFEAVSRLLLHSFRMELNIRVRIEGAPAGSLPRYESKAKRYKRIP